MRRNTLLLHGDVAPMPIHQTTAFGYKTAEKLENIFNGHEPGFLYTRINNPTIDVFERRISLLEGGIGAIACASGMAAISLALLNLLRSGDQILSGSGIFGGTYSLFESLEAFGIATSYAEDNAMDSFAVKITDHTRAIYVETIGNPKLDVTDIRKLSALAHTHGIPLIVDNTVTTPYLFQPIDYGADIVVHSTSKYINGSGNSIGGMIVDSGKFKWDVNKFISLKEFEKYGRFAYLAKLRKGMFKDFGPCLSPLNAFLNGIGLDTLGLRMDRLCDNAAKLAAALQQHRQVVAVNYPGLPDNPNYSIAQQQFGGKFGALLTIRVGSKQNAFKVINHLQYAYNLANIGDVRTLVIHPATTLYAANTPQDREAAGVYDDLIQISVGLEDIEDLQEDFYQALQKIL